jgi:hypothetical protein
MAAHRVLAPASAGTSLNPCGCTGTFGPTTWPLLRVLSAGYQWQWPGDGAVAVAQRCAVTSWTKEVREVLFERKKALNAAPGPAAGSPVQSSRAAHRWRLINQPQSGKRQSASKWLALSVTTALCVLGFPGMASAAATSGGLQLTVSPKVSAADTPLSIRVGGLPSGAKVTLAVTSVDAAGIKWSASGTFLATSAGTVDPATSPPQSAGGSVEYTGTDPTGPADFMTAGPSAQPADVLTPVWPFGLPGEWGTQ